MLDVRRLEVLVVAVREGSLAAAARALNLTPSAASQAVGALEAGVGCRLLERHGRGVRPTEAGERLALRAQAVLADLVAAEDEVMGRREAGVVLAAPPTVVAGLVPGVLDRLREQEPDLRVVVIESDGPRASAALRDEQVDIAVVDRHAHLGPAAGSGTVSSVLLDEPVLLWLPSSHPLATREWIGLRELRDEPWIASPPLSTCAELLAHAAASAGFAPRVVATCGEYRSIARLVAAGHGVSLVPRLALTAADVDIAVVALRPQVIRRLTVLLRAGHRPHATRAVLHALEATAHNEERSGTP